MCCCTKNKLKLKNNISHLTDKSEIRAMNQIQSEQISNLETIKKYVKSRLQIPSVSFYVDCENKCHNIFVYLLLYISMNELWDSTNVYLYTGNMDMSPYKFLFKNDSVKIYENEALIKQLADVKLSWDIFEQSVHRKVPGKHVIVAGGDKRYRALEHLLKKEGVQVTLIEKQNKDTLTNTFAKINGIFNL
jgi:hypothetical protein